MSALDPAPEWARELERRHARAMHHGEPCLGSIGLIDAATRMRGIASVVEGQTLSLGLAVSAGPVVRGGEPRESFDLQVHVEANERLVVGSDRIELDAHGMSNTHLDGLAHIGIDGQWHGGVPSSSIFEDDESLIAWARHGIVTRGVLVDVPGHRGDAWVANGDPVTGDEIEACLASDGVVFEPGDALLLYMGRDRFEAEGNRYLPLAEASGGRPGVHHTGAQWIADNGVSVVCWDFLDAHGAGSDPLSVHLLIWAIGLALVDSCHLGEAAQAMRVAGRTSGLLTVAPLALHRATGCMVNPVLLY
jgi:kynurenine formamidase